MKTEIDLDVCKFLLPKFHYIPPGRFMMGSPATEPERISNETLHEVVLTSGFWLAETACTQELWEAVMGSNPSSFKGKRRPVENVSWNDCIAFLEKINRLMPGLDLRLPTEAEWEYACRAGTQTPFSFGDTITTDQVNYDGNYPYNKGRKGKYRKETVEVRSLPCNDWGLYEMHGTVWEWCSDWYGEDSSDSVIDPSGSDGGTFRVLRGGSWRGDAWYVRSANRYGADPADRRGGIGFRFAVGC
jgi:sulfatase modifying factor 1